MATNFFKTQWSDRGPVERIVILGGAIGGGIFLLIKGKKIIEAIKNRQKDQTFQGDLNELITGGKNLSYQDSQYLIFADSLYQAMKGYGTDETSIAGIMYKMKNDADVLKLVQSFGQKDGYTLPEWIADDFSQDDKTFYINNILAKKGIQYRF